MDNLQNIAALLAVVFYWLFSAAVTIRVITRRRPVSGTLAWLMVIYVIPLIGAVLYLMIGELNLGRRHAKRTRAMIFTRRASFPGHSSAADRAQRRKRTWLFSNAVAG